MADDYPGANVLPIRIRENLVVHIALIPLDLTRLEAEKICRIVMAMALPDETADETADEYT